MKGKISMQGHREHSDIADAIAENTAAIRCILDAVKEEGAWWRSRRGLATQQGLREMEDRIMSVISEFAAKQKSFNEKLSAGLDAVTASTDSIATDVQGLKDLITQLQNSPGEVTAEDAGLITELETSITALDAKLDALSAKVTAVDDLTPPTPPA